MAQEGKDNKLRSVLKASQNFDWAYAFTWLFVFALTIGIELINANFDWSVVSTADFWLAVLMINFLSGVILISAKNKADKKRRSQSEEYKNHKKIVDNTVTTSTYEDLPDYIAYENKKRKKKAWKNKVRLKIAKLDKVRLLFGTKQRDIDIWNSNDKNAKNKNKYCKKRQALIDKLDDKWINKNIHFTRVKYNVLTETALTAGVNAENDEFIAVNHKKKQTKELSPNFIYSMAMVAFFYSLIPDLIELTIVTAISIVFKLFIISWRYLYGKEYGYDYVDRVRLPEMIQRENELKKYLFWRKDKLNKKES